MRKGIDGKVVGKDGRVGSGGNVTPVGMVPGKLGRGGILGREG